MSLLSTDITKIKKLSLKGVELPAPKKRDTAPIKKVDKPQRVKAPKKRDTAPIKKVDKPQRVKAPKVEKPKTDWEKLNRNTRSFWIAGGRGGEIGWLNHRKAFNKRIN